MTRRRFRKMGRSTWGTRLNDEMNSNHQLFRHRQLSVQCQTVWICSALKLKLIYCVMDNPAQLTHQWIQFDINVCLETCHCLHCVYSASLISTENEIAAKPQCHRFDMSSFLVPMPKQLIISCIIMLFWHPHLKVFTYIVKSVLSTSCRVNIRRAHVQTPECLRKSRVLAFRFFFQRKTILLHILSRKIVVVNLPYTALWQPFLNLLNVSVLVKGKRQPCDHLFRNLCPQQVGGRIIQTFHIEI